jgi:hypothetical protein
LIAKRSGMKRDGGLQDCHFFARVGEKRRTSC